jgi:hypothetical protein
MKDALLWTTRIAALYAAFLSSNPIAIGVLLLERGGCFL